MGQNQREAVLPCLGQDPAEALSQKIMDLIDIHIKVPSLRLRNICPAHGGKLDLGYEHGAQKSAIVLPDIAFRKG